MSQFAQESSPLSSPPSSILDSISPEAPSSPSPVSSQPIQPGASPLAQPSHPVDDACAPSKSPKREHDEIGEETVTAQSRKKCRATPAAEQPPALEEANLPSTETTTQPVTTSNRPSRTRKPPQKFGAVEERTQKAAETANGVKKPPSRVFDPVFITSNANSRLGKADVYHMLLEDRAWTSLTTSQQNTLLSMLPLSPETQKSLDKIAAAGGTDPDSELIPRPQAFTMSNDCFRTDVAKFKEDLKNGHLAKTWQAAAEQAVVERANGTYDKWKAEEAEMWWGQKSG